MRAILFCNEMLGLAHLRLSLLVAEAIVARGGESSTALVATGSPAFGTLRPSYGVDVLKLPSAHVGDSSWVATGLRPPTGLALERLEVAQLRADLSLAAVTALRPQIAVVDYRPLGRDDHLVPALERLRADGATVALGLWDIDDAPERLRLLWTDELCQAVKDFYDLAFLYGPGEDDFRVEALRSVGVPVHRTARLAPPPATRPAADLGSGYLLVMAGGGADGQPLLDAVVEAIRAHPLDVDTLLVPGPMLDAEAVRGLSERAQGLRIRVLQARGDMPEVLAGARAVVAMAGICTVAEVFAAGRPALLVPRVFPREEQLNRARWLAAQGLVRMLLPDQLEPARLAAAINEVLEQPVRSAERATGAEEAAQILYTEAARPARSG